VKLFHVIMSRQCGDHLFVLSHGSLLDFFHFEGSTALIVVDAFSKFIDVRVMKSTNDIHLIEQLESFFANLELLRR
jgi:hypothetical protein